METRWPTVKTKIWQVSHSIVRCVFPEQRCIIKSYCMWYKRFPGSVLVAVELNQSIREGAPLPEQDYPWWIALCSMTSSPPQLQLSSLPQNQCSWSVYLLVLPALVLFPQQTKYTALATTHGSPTFCCSCWRVSASLEDAHPLLAYNC